MTTKLIKLRLENIGGFHNFELNFHEKLTVLIGKNGAGKTTILRSIALLFDMALDTLLEFSSKLPKHEADSHISIDLSIDGKTVSLNSDNTSSDSLFGKITLMGIYV